MSNPIDLSWRSSWAQFAIAQQISKTLTSAQARAGDGAQMPIGGGGAFPVDSEHLPRLEYKIPKPTNNDPLTVAVVGAGCAGLFVPMIFNKLRATLKEKNLPDLPVNCEVFEAGPENRLGGRVYTYKFSKDPHDYYDVGAMRFPEIKIMKRTFDLFENELLMPKVEHPTADTPTGSLIPYIYNSSSGQQPVYFNDIQYPNPPDPSKTANPYKIFKDSDKWTHVDPGKLLAEQVKYFTDLLISNPKDGWDRLMTYDELSTRQFFYQPFHWIDKDGKKHTREAYDYETVEWLETFNSGTRWFDQAFSETVLEEAIFASSAPWWCIMGGTQQVARKMLDQVMKDSPSTKMSFESLVTAIGIDSTSANPDPKGKPDITVGGQTKSYDAVFNSVPLGCMRRMDLRKLPLTYGTKQALRSLNYGASTKVGMRFKNMWWRQDPFNISGGLGKTDLPLRVCVYPSYNLEDQPENGGVLLCSYCWAQDADRMGALIDNDGLGGDKPQKLKELLIHNLTLLHCKTGDQDDYNKVRQLIVGADGTNLQEIHGFDWTRNELSTGAFAWFGPGQFWNMYPEIISTDGRHIVIGEIASSHHAWIVGALESAVRGVYQFLCAQAQKGHEGSAAALKLYDEDEVPSPYGPLPPEYNRSTYWKDENNESVEKPAIGEMAKFLTALEGIRLDTEAARAA